MIAARLVVLIGLLLTSCATAPERTRQAADADRLSSDGREAYANGAWRVAVARFSAAADAARAGDDRTRLARELHNRGLALLATGSAAAAAADLQESLSLSTGPETAATHLALAAALADLGQVAEALNAADLARTSASDQPGLRARAAAAAAILALKTGDTLGASSRLQDLDPGQDQGALGAISQAHATLALATGDHQAAELAGAKAVEHLRAAGDLPGLAAALSTWARTATAAGQPAVAAERWRRAAGVPVGGPERIQACLHAANE